MSGALYIKGKILDTFGTNYAKAIDDLSSKVFIPALICSIWVEFGPMIQSKTGFGLIETYALIAVVGGLAAWCIMYLMILASIYIFRGYDVGPYLGIIVMPLGFAGLFPDQFNELNIPYSQATGFAILAWSFMLVKGEKFFRGLFGDD